MTRPVFEAQELQKGFQTNAGGVLAARRAHACVTLLMTSGLMLATITIVVIVSIEVVKAAALH
jgi:hypothetical protein